MTFKRIFARKDKSFGQTITVGEFEIHEIFDKFIGLNIVLKVCISRFENLVENESFIWGLIHPFDLKEKLNDAHFAISKALY